MPNQKLSREILSAALVGLEAQREQVDSRIAEVRRMLRARPEATAADGTPQAAAPKARRQRRGMSAAARRRIAEAQRKRWEAYHRAQQTPSTSKKAAGKPAARAKRRISAAGRKAIADAARKRWAEFRKAAAKAPAKAAKKAGKKEPASIVVTE